MDEEWSVVRTRRVKKRKSFKPLLWFHRQTLQTCLCFLILLSPPLFKSRHFHTKLTSPLTSQPSQAPLIWPQVLFPGSSMVASVLVIGNLSHYYPFPHQILMQLCFNRSRCLQLTICWRLYLLEQMVPLTQIWLLPLLLSFHTYLIITHHRQRATLRAAGQIV